MADRCLRLIGRVAASPARPRPFRSLSVLALLGALGAGASSAPAQPCPEEPTLQHYTGGGQFVCPCFVPGEEAGAVFNAPVDHFPIEILRVGIGWASQFGGTGQQLEQAVHVYGAGLPNPGARLRSLYGPVLIDGAINVFDLEAQLGNVVVNAGPFSVTLEILNQNAGDFFAPSVVYDGNGCQPGKNLIKAVPGGWFDACSQGVNGDWIFFVVYRQTGCGPTGIGDERILANRPAFLFAPRPNPARAGRSTIEFVLAEAGEARLAVFDARGRRIRTLADRRFDAGAHRVEWDGSSTDGAPPTPGVYFLRLEAAGLVETRKLVVEP